MRPPSQQNIAAIFAIKTKFDVTTSDLPLPNINVFPKKEGVVSTRDCSIPAATANQLDSFFCHCDCDFGFCFLVNHLGS